MNWVLYFSFFGFSTTISTSVLLLSIPICVAFDWPWSSSRPVAEHRNERHPALKGSTFESETEASFVSNRPMVREAQQILGRKENALDYSCWQSAYKDLLSSCREILRDEEKKCRLAYQLTECFLKMTGWPAPPHCSKNELAKKCTEKLDKHTHALYLAFFIDTASMCHHLQSEAFKTETENVVNDLKNSAHWLVDKLTEMEAQSEEMLLHVFEHSDKIEGKLTGIESQSQALLEQTGKMDGKLKEMEDTSQAIFEHSDQIIKMQIKLREEHAQMQESVDEGMKGIQEAAQETHEQLTGVAEVQKQIAEQQRHLAEAMVAEIEKLQDKANDISYSMAKSLTEQAQLLSGQEDLRVGQGQALRTMNDLQQLQVSAMEETRSSLTELAQDARKQQIDFKIWQTELDQMHQRLVGGSTAMLKAQEAFASKQGAIFTTLDRLFSLYNTILYESRALKTLFFYGISLIFVHLLTSAKQTNNARGLLFAGLCFSFGIELWLVWLYGRVIHNQSWIQMRTYWVRATFGVFIASSFTYFLFTYRDIASRNNQLLVDLHRKLVDILPSSKAQERNFYRKASLQHVLAKGWHGLDEGGGGYEEGECSYPWLERPRTRRDETMASKILRRAHGFFRKRKKPRPTEICHQEEKKDDPLRTWMHGKGMDIRVLDQEEDNHHDPDFAPPPSTSRSDRDHFLPLRLPRYSLRSECRQRTTQRDGGSICIHQQRMHLKKGGSLMRRP